MNGAVYGVSLTQVFRAGSKSVMYHCVIPVSTIFNCGIFNRNPKFEACARTLTDMSDLGVCAGVLDFFPLLCARLRCRSQTLLQPLQRTILGTRMQPRQPRQHCSVTFCQQFRDGVCSSLMSLIQAHIFVPCSQEVGR